MLYTNPYCALITAGIIFAFVALMHLLRLIYKTPVKIGNKIIPMWVSGVGFIVPLVLSIWMFSAGSSLTTTPVVVNDTLTAQY